MDPNNSWEATTFSATQESPYILCNPKVFNRVQRSLPLIPILGQKNPVHTTSSYFYELYFNIILPPTFMSS
jgi:hypothetical protein